MAEEQESPGLMDRVKGAFSGGDDEEGGPGGEGSRVEEVRAALKAFGAGETDDFLAALDEDVEWISPSGEDFPGGGTHRGRDAVRENYVEAVSKRFGDFGFIPRVFLEGADDDADFVVVLGAFRGSGGGNDLDAPAVQVWEFGGGDRAAKVHVYADSEQFRGVGSKEDEAGEDEAGEDGAGEDEERGTETEASAEAHDEGSQGDDAEGDGSEGDGSEGDGSEGDGSEGDGSEGDALEGEEEGSRE